MEEIVLARVHMNKAAAPKTVQVCFLDLNMLQIKVFKYVQVNFLLSLWAKFLRSVIFFLRINFCWYLLQNLKISVQHPQYISPTIWGMYILFDVPTLHYIFLDVQTTSLVQLAKPHSLKLCGLYPFYLQCSFCYYVIGKAISVKYLDSLFQSMYNV